MNLAAPLAPGARIGILGGGQLGRMLALAAARLGFETHVFAPEEDSPAARVAAAWTRADYGDQAALARFAQLVDVATYEFENVPVEAVRAIEAAGAPVRPGAKALEVGQDRLVEKRFLNGCGVATTPFRPVETAQDLHAAIAALGLPAVLKTRRFGYDGKGQAWIRTAADAEGALAAMGGRPAILEAAAAFAFEASIVAARGLDGETRCFDPAQNRHENGVLAESLAPADPAIAAPAEAAARALLTRLDYVGVLAIEFFVMPDGTLLANEFAPRVHNSGHWTVDACAVSQFEQHVRAIAGWPLMEPSLPPGVRARMRNLIGEDALGWPAIAADPAARITLYGKREVKPGRKMGHVTWISREP